MSSMRAAPSMTCRFVTAMPALTRKPVPSSFGVPTTNTARRACSAISSTVSAPCVRVRSDPDAAPGRGCTEAPSAMDRGGVVTSAAALHAGGLAMVLLHPMPSTATNTLIELALNIAASIPAAMRTIAPCSHSRLGHTWVCVRCRVHHHTVRHLRYGLVASFKPHLGMASLQDRNEAVLSRLVDQAAGRETKPEGRVGA